jgi:hypothetical protein
MHTRDYSFFILDDEICIKEGPVSIIVDHAVIMSIVYLDHWDSLKTFEKEFAVWYQEQILIQGFLGELSFIVSSSFLEPYDQEALCREILNFLREPPELNSNQFLN